ncbi:EAL domain-containing protein [Aliikangiella marina]|uniref:EAL domain-containing protein n=1 Tax=Aliikangiella marina TaxID=1712262 RepID=A0A545TEC1_9GAMM|nr:EAL domain-containing protein [Aliikangiella marina]TQV75564.1 EAL domain-containing protein [Aliikangiella marina]
MELSSLPFEQEDELLLQIAKDTLTRLKGDTLHLFESKPDEIRSRLIINNSSDHLDSISFKITIDSPLSLRQQHFECYSVQESNDPFIKQLEAINAVYLPIYNALDKQLGSLVLSFKEITETPAQSDIELETNALIYFFRAYLLQEQQIDSDYLLLEIAQFAKIGYWYRDMVTDRVIWSKETFEIFGEVPFSFHPTVDQYYEYLHPNDFLAMKEAEKNSVFNKVKLNIDHRIILKSGEVRWIHLQGQLRRDRQGNPIEFFGMVQDITEQKEKERYLKEISHTDFLTGLKNRRGFLDFLDQTIANSTQSHQQFFVTYIDLDYFKEINDIYGHEVGDFVLSQFGKRLIAAIPENAQLARIGGDEFAMITHDTEEHMITIDKIFNALRYPFELSDIEVTMSASMGSAIFPDDALTATGLLALADDAMFFAKKEGKNKFRLFEPEIQSSIERSSTIRKKLSEICGSHYGLSLAYQPIITHDNSQYNHFESLLRWHDDELGSISPAEFIPIAEESGLIHHLTDFVVKQVVNDLQEKVSRLPDDVTFSINISAFDLSKPSNGLSTLYDALNSNPSLAKHINVEYTETALMEDEALVLKNLNTLREKGIRIALDDFGTGYSSMTHCHHFPVDIIKIDRSFIHDYHSNVASRNIVDCIFYMADVMGLDIIVEGVEDQQTCESLKSKAFGMQGYFFAKPERLESFLQSSD